MASTSTGVQSSVTPALVENVHGAESNRHRWYLDWGNLLLLAVAITTGAYLAWIVFEWGSDRTLTLVQELGFLPIMLIGTVFAWRTAWLLGRHNTAPDAQRAWTLLGFAFLLWLLGDSIWAYYLVFYESFPLASLVSASFIVALALIIFGFLAFPVMGLDEDQLRVFRLDTSIILIGVIALIGFYVVGPEQLRYGEGTIDAVGLFIYTSATVAALLISCRALVLRPAYGAATPVLLMVIGLAIVGSTNLVWAYFEIRGVQLSGGATYGAWMLGQSILVAGPQVHFWILKRGRGFDRVDSLIDQSHTLIPYCAAGIGMLVLTSTTAYVLANFMGVVAMLVLGLVGLIVVRQFVSLRQNAVLQAAQAVRETENWFRMLVMYSSDMVTVIDHVCSCRYQSSSATEISRYLPECLVGSDFLTWIHPCDRQHVRNAIDLVIDSETDTTMAKVEWRLNTGDETMIHFETIISNRLDDPTVNGLVLNSRDVTERKSLEDRLTYQAYHDPLTNLPNRAMFFNQLSDAVRSVEPGRGLALLFVDLDDFKLINDRFGHETGDQYLKAFSQQLQSMLRPGDTLSRLAGDEFTILARDVGSAEAAIERARQVLRSAEQPIPLGNESTSISMSIGVAFTTDPNTAPGELVHRADTAMYAAKNSGRGDAILYDPAMSR